MQRGFTLIEAVIYIALLALIVGGAVLAAYRLIDSGAITATHTTVQDEGDFVLRKLSWALSGASDVSGSGSSLTVTRYDGTTVYFQLTGTTIQMRESALGASYADITTPNVKASALQFVVTAGPPKSVSGTFSLKTANGTDVALPFTFKRYIRQ